MDLKSVPGEYKHSSSKNMGPSDGPQTQKYSFLEKYVLKRR
jgi:hypothetical protein